MFKKSLDLGLMLTKKGCDATMSVDLLLSEPDNVLPSENISGRIGRGSAIGVFVSSLPQLMQQCSRPVIHYSGTI